MIAVCQWSIYLGCAGASTGQVPAADSEALSRVIASGHEGLTRVLVAGDDFGDAMQELSQVCTELRTRSERVPAIFRCQGRKSRRRDLPGDCQVIDRV